MTIEIKTMNVEPKRQTFGHVARRLGDRTPSRYDEGMYDLQSTENSHYKPLWDAEHWLYDTSKTQVKMEDWYALRDPRQYYYGAYTIARANMNQATERNFNFVEKRNMLANIDSEWREKVDLYLIPLRHYEWGANMNACYITDAGYGTAVTSAAIFSTGDRLGNAQILSRVGIALGDGGADVLDKAKDAWMDAPEWQGIRRMTEDSLVVKDWFETFTAQLLAMDGVIHPLVFNHFDMAGQKHGGTALSMMCEFAVDWGTEHNRWVDAVIKVAAAESDENKALISGWFVKWRDQALAAVKPLTEAVLADDADAAISSVADQLNARAAKLGLNI